MFDKTITLFNRYHGRYGDTWYPHVIKNVQLMTDKAQIVARYGAQASDSASLIINIEDGMQIDGTPYLAPKEWAKLTNDELANYVTLNDDAQYFDFFIVGEYATDVVNDEDYTNGFYNYVNAENDYVYAITSVGGPYSLIPHFEIMAR